MRDSDWPGVSGDVQAIRRQAARRLLQIKGVLLRPDEPFTFSSGMKSPMYCDNRLILSYPLVREAVAKGLAALLAAEYPGAECVAGVATGAIAHAALVAARLRLPMVYVRSAPKGHGVQNRVEGRILPGARVAVLEDTVTTGASLLSAIQALRAEGAEVTTAFTVLEYGFPETKQAFHAAGVRLLSLTDLDAVIEAAVAEGWLHEGQIHLMREFQRDPKGFANASFQGPGDH